MQNLQGAKPGPVTQINSANQKNKATSIKEGY